MVVKVIHELKFAFNFLPFPHHLRPTPISYLEFWS